MFTEDGVVEDNLLEQLDELIGQVGRHEGLHRHRDVFWVLSLRQRCLHNLHMEGTWGLVQWKTNIWSCTLWCKFENKNVKVKDARHKELDSFKKTEF